MFKKKANFIKGFFSGDLPLFYLADNVGTIVINSREMGLEYKRKIFKFAKNGLDINAGYNMAFSELKCIFCQDKMLRGNWNDSLPLFTFWDKSKSVYFSRRKTKKATFVHFCPKCCCFFHHNLKIVKK